MDSVIVASTANGSACCSHTQTTTGPGPPASNTIATLASNTITAGGNANVIIGPAAIVPPDPFEDQRKIANWLSPLNSHQVHKDVFEKVMKGTGSWIFEHTGFTNWLSRKTNTLWGAGMPGAGKTCLTSIVINHLVNEKHAAVLYIYCQYQNQLSTTDILAGLLKQAVESSEKVAAHVSGSLHRRCLRTDTKPSRSEILAALHEAIQQLPELYLVVDALDELRDDVLPELICDLVSLQQPLFMTSRILSDLPEIKEPDFTIRADNDDLHTFISSRIKNAFRLAPFLREPSARADLVNKIYRKCDGMFLLAALQVEALATGDIISLHSLQEAVDQLPASLNERYEQTFERIRKQGGQRQNLACQTILLLTHATRSLSVDELLEALTVDTDTASVQRERRTAVETLISVCFGLLAIEKESGTVQLIHYTAQEFFETRADLGPGDPHTVIADVLAIYLSQIEIADEDSDIGRKDLQPTPYRNYPFFDYAGRNLGHHTHQSCLNRHGQVPTQVNLLFRNRSRVPLPLTPMSKDFDLGQAVHFAALYNLVSLLNENTQFLNDHSAQRCSPLFYACLGGHTSLAVTIMSRLRQPKLMISNATKFGANVLHAASRSGQLSLMRALLPMCGHKDINARTFQNGWTPLHQAALTGDENVVRLLLNSGKADIHATTEDGFTLLFIAAEKGLESIVRLLLESPEIEVDARGPGERTPLHQAAQNGHEAVIRLLLRSASVDINVRDRRQLVPLHLAADHGHERVVLLLLSFANVDINIRTNDGWTPLHLAAQNGHESIVRLLLSFANVDINTPTNDGWTPLHAAAQNGHESIVRLLLNSISTGINAKGPSGRTPLHQAAQNGHEPIVRLLLSFTNIDIHTKGEDGWTPLHQAAHGGHESIAQLLLNSAGADFHAKTEEGWTLLHLAAEAGAVNIVRLLLEHAGIEVDARGLRGRTPLHQAAQNGHEPVVRLILNFSNADINTADDLGLTALHIAANNGHEAVVRLLLSSPGIDAHARSTGGSFVDKTPLDLARERHHQHVVAVFEEMGFAERDVEINDVERMTQVLDQEQKPMRRRRVIRVITHILRFIQKTKRVTK